MASGNDRNTKIHDLGFDTGATFKASEDALILYDTRGYSPRRLVVLTTDQMNALVAYWQDGLCPVCYTEIQGRDTICDDCLKTAISNRL